MAIVLTTPSQWSSSLLPHAQRTEKSTMRIQEAGDVTKVKLHSNAIAIKERTSGEADKYWWKWNKEMGEFNITSPSTIEHGEKDHTSFHWSLRFLGHVLYGIMRLFLSCVRAPQDAPCFLLSLLRFAVYCCESFKKEMRMRWSLNF